MPARWEVCCLRGEEDPIHPSSGRSSLGCPSQLGGGAFQCLPGCSVGGSVVGAGDSAFPLPLCWACILLGRNTCCPAARDRQTGMLLLWNMAG